ncbi:hypothetical protein CLPU_7c01020 [Gottschalkia purinilytica]|uniref:Uncharacterized protein n=1 Tax=Gottschalkia purinilytica TaxID=1503 RepID=A0A0L0WAE1_GOTPU|nr:hypothetical protein [Gottschalkia purinilytica]KNF08474.1 hypothetical protein CLPU_7c01020 [Gottschalkia purinilytica]
MEVLYPSDFQKNEMYGYVTIDKSHFCRINLKYESIQYCILVDVIFYQYEYRGCTEEFLTFLIRYCTGAEQYW